MTDQPNCHRCQHRRSIPGNHHSACGHPAVAEIASSPLAQLAAIVGYMPPMEPEVLGVTGHEHGIERGWFAWPVWLLTCDGFEGKASSAPDSLESR